MKYFYHWKNVVNVGIISVENNIFAPLNFHSLFGSSTNDSICIPFLFIQPWKRWGFTPRSGQHGFAPTSDMGKAFLINSCMWGGYWKYSTELYFYWDFSFYELLCFQVFKTPSGLQWKASDSKKVHHLDPSTEKKALITYIRAGPVPNGVETVSQFACLSS